VTWFAIGLSLLIPVYAEEPSFPDWLGGKPDTKIKPDRCNVYDWFFKEADKQSEGLASKQDLARKRIINIVNKLVDTHRGARLEQYSGKVKYLVIGERKPFHFTFRMESELLEQLLDKDCPE